MTSRSGLGSWIIGSSVEFEHPGHVASLTYLQHQKLSLLTREPSGSAPSARQSWSTDWQLRGVDSSEVGRVQAAANAR
jgi:hypothetical protein